MDGLQRTASRFAVSSTRATRAPTLLAVALGSALAACAPEALEGPDPDGRDGAPVTAALPTDSEGALDGWRLVWADEFDGGGIDGDKWRFEVHGPGWVNDERQSYTSRWENARVENGHLVIEGRRDWAGSEYTSARLETAGKASWTYGRFEARMQLPGGVGTWPAFWLLPDDMGEGWPRCGEIDIMEEVGYDPNTIHGTVHTDWNNWTQHNEKFQTIGVDGATSAYHLYAIEWTPDRIDWTVDGRLYLTVYNEHTGRGGWPFDRPFHIILNLAIGGNWGAAAGIDPGAYPRQMLVDSVRVYQR